MEIVSSSLFSEWFDLSPAAFPFNPQRLAAIASRRQSLGSMLFFDELLQIAGLGSEHEPLSNHLYPPTDAVSFKRLLMAIEGCEWDEMKRDCLIYYILKHWGDGREKDFAGRRHIPPQFVSLSSAYFYLDSGNEDIPTAVALLCDIRVKPDFMSKILRTISLASPELVLQFVSVGKPVLTNHDDLDVYMGALCQSSRIMDAWLYQRKFPEDPEEGCIRKRFIDMILDHCLIPKPRPSLLKPLLAFPFSPYEQSHVTSYALHPPASLSETSHAILQDLISVRLVHQGRYSEAIGLDRLFVRAAAVSGRVGEGAVTKAAEERRKMFNELTNILPGVQKKILEVQREDSEAIASNRTTVPAEAMSVDAEPDMTMSWEEVAPGGAASAPIPSAPATPRRGATPSASPFAKTPAPTPLTASSALRQSNPKVAVLKAFARSSLHMEGSPLRHSTSPSGTPGSITPVASSRSAGVLASTPQRAPRAQSQHMFNSPGPASLGASRGFLTSRTSLSRSFLNSKSTTPASQWDEPPVQGQASRWPFNNTQATKPAQEQQQPSQPNPFARSDRVARTPAKRARPMTESPMDASYEPSRTTRDWDDADAEMDAAPEEHGQGEEREYSDDDVVLDPPPSSFVDRRLVAQNLARAGAGAPAQQPIVEEREVASEPIFPSGRTLRRSIGAAADQDRAPQQESKVALPGAFPAEESQNAVAAKEPTRSTRARTSVPTARTKPITDSAADDAENSTKPTNRRRTIATSKLPRATTRTSRASMSVEPESEAENTAGRTVRRSTRLSSVASSMGSPERKKPRSSVSVEPETPGSPPAQPQPQTGTRGRRKAGSSRLTSGLGGGRRRPQTVQEE